MSSHRRMVDALAKFSETTPPRAAPVQSTTKQETHMFRHMIEAGQQLLEQEILRAMVAAKEYDAKGFTLKAASRRNKAVDYTLRLSRLASWAEERAARVPKARLAAVHHFAKP